jgi:hypothetical protein
MVKTHGAPDGERRVGLPALLLGVLVALLIIGGTYWYATTRVYVTITIAGSGTARITYGAGSNRAQVTERLPWSKNVAADGEAGMIVVAERTGDDTGPLSCAITSGGMSLASQMSSGALAVVTCDSRR